MELPRPMMRGSVATLCAVLSIAVVLGTLGGCVPSRDAANAGARRGGPAVTPGDDSGEPTSSAWASTDSVLHVRGRVEYFNGKRPSQPGAVAATVSEIELWQDAPRQRLRKSVRTPVPAGGMRSFQEELISDGVWTVLQSQDEQAKARRWFNVLRYDAAAGWPDPSETLESVTVVADVPLLASRLATGVVTSESTSTIDGEPIRLVAYRAETEDRTTETTIQIDALSGLLTRIERFSWYTGPGGEQLVEDSRLITYDVVEKVARTRIKAGTFDLELPPDVPVITSLSLSRSQASRLDDVNVYWLGSRWESLVAAGSVKYASSSAEPFRHWGGSVRRGGPDAAAASRPVLSNTSAEVAYAGLGVGSPQLSVVSMPRVPPSSWRSRLGGRPMTETAIAGATALLTSGGWSSTDQAGFTRTETYWYLIVDRPDATVLLQGYKLTPEGLIRAAEKVVPLP